MAGEQKRFARFFFYLRNLREAALHTGARAEEADAGNIEAGCASYGDNSITPLASL